LNDSADAADASRPALVSLAAPMSSKGTRSGNPLTVFAGPSTGLMP